MLLNLRRKRVRATQHASRGPFSVLEHRNSLAEIFERRAVVLVERHRANLPHRELECIGASENTQRHGYRFAHQHPGFFEAPKFHEGMRVVVGCHRVKTNLAACYSDLGYQEKALELKREIYNRRCLVDSEHTLPSLVAAVNLANTLLALDRFSACRSFALERIPDAERVLGSEHDVTMGFRKIYAVALFRCPEATLSDTQLAVRTLEGCVKMSRRVMGKPHPRTLETELVLRRAREQLATYKD